MEYFVSLFLGTFVLEDLALASSVALMAEGKVSFSLAFWACFLGISIGDVGLYLIGLAGSYFGLDNHFAFLKKYKTQIQQFKDSAALSYGIVVSRMIPGTRWPTYVAAGYLKYSFLKFLSLTLMSVFVWVLVALSIGATITSIFADHWLVVVLLFFVGH